MVFFRINDVDIMKTCKSPKMRLLSKLLVTLQPQWAPFVENMQSTQLKVKKKPFSILAAQKPGSVVLRSQLAPQEQGRLDSSRPPPSQAAKAPPRKPSTQHSTGLKAPPTAQTHRNPPRAGSCRPRP